MNTTRKATEKIRLQHWAEVISQCQSSGISAKEWIAQNHISRDAYYYWLRKVKLSALDQNSSDKGIVEITAPIEVPETAITNETINSEIAAQTPEIILHKGDFTIEIMSTASSHLLQTLLKELRNA